MRVRACVRACVAAAGMSSPRSRISCRPTFHERNACTRLQHVYELVDGVVDSLGKPLRGVVHRGQALPVGLPSRRPQQRRRQRRRKQQQKTTTATATAAAATHKRQKLVLDEPQGDKRTVEVTPLSHKAHYNSARRSEQCHGTRQHGLVLLQQPLQPLHAAVAVIDGSHDLLCFFRSRSILRMIIIGIGRRSTLVVAVVVVVVVSRFRLRCRSTSTSTIIKQQQRQNSNNTRTLAHACTVLRFCDRKQSTGCVLGEASAEIAGTTARQNQRQGRENRKSTLARSALRPKGSTHTSTRPRPTAAIQGLHWCLLAVCCLLLLLLLQVQVQVQVLLRLLLLLCETRLQAARGVFELHQRRGRGSAECADVATATTTTTTTTTPNAAVGRASDQERVVTAVLAETTPLSRVCVAS
jgi:hypothetical protein